MTAVISTCGQYRYKLTRLGDLMSPLGPAVFVMLNPSTADADLDDPTIRRCRSFAQTWGCNGLVVVNLYGLRSTNPAGLWSHPDPVGPENDQHLAGLPNNAGVVVCAWGANARDDRVAASVTVLRASGHRLLCLGITKNGAPRHPLYVKGDQPLVEWVLR